MASICMSQANYQQQHHHLQQQFQLLNGSNAGILLLQQQQHQQQTTVYSKRQATAQPPPPTKAPLGTSHLQNIQPRVSGSGAGLVAMLPKKKYNYANVPYGEQLPSVARRNARERNRVKQVNNGFSNLRQHLPQTVINTLSHGGRGASKKLSKVDTLRIAVEYIRGLQDLLEDAGATSSNMISSTASVFQLDESSNDGSNFDDYSQMDSPTHEPSYQPMQHYHSEASASPTPSYTDSDISIGGVNYLQPITLEGAKQHQHQHQQQQQQQPTVNQQMQFKFEPFDTYEQPDDEELLDYISSWQQQ